MYHQWFNYNHSVLFQQACALKAASKSLMSSEKIKRMLEVRINALSRHILNFKCV